MGGLVVWICLWMKEFLPKKRSTNFLDKLSQEMRNQIFRCVHDARGGGVRVKMNASNLFSLNLLFIFWTYYTACLACLIVCSFGGQFHSLLLRSPRHVRDDDDASAEPTSKGLLKTKSKFTKLSCGWSLGRPFWTQLNETTPSRG